MTTFAAELRRALTRRGAGRPDLVRATGACSTLAKRWMEGTAYPDQDRVVIIAELLHWPSLLARAIEDRTGTCEGCGGGTFVTRGSVKARFCGPRCRRRIFDRIQYARKADQDRKIMRLELEEFREDVGNFCRHCEPEGICRDDGCWLRRSSPLPFIPLSKVSRRAA